MWEVLYKKVENNFEIILNFINMHDLIDKYLIVDTYIWSSGMLFYTLKHYIVVMLHENPYCI